MVYRREVPVSRFVSWMLGLPNLIRPACLGLSLRLSNLTGQIRYMAVDLPRPLTNFRGLVCN